MPSPTFRAPHTSYSSHVVITGRTSIQLIACGDKSPSRRPTPGCDGDYWQAPKDHAAQHTSKMELVSCLRKWHFESRLVHVGIGLVELRPFRTHARCVCLPKCRERCQHRVGTHRIRLFLDGAIQHQSAIGVDVEREREFTRFPVCIGRGNNEFLVIGDCDLIPAVVDVRNRFRVLSKRHIELLPIWKSASTESLQSEHSACEPQADGANERDLMDRLPESGLLGC